MILFRCGRQYTMKIMSNHESCPTQLVVIHVRLKVDVTQNIMNGYDHFVGSNAMNLITLYLNFTSCGVICKLKRHYSWLSPYGASNVRCFTSPLLTAGPERLDSPSLIVKI